MALVNWGSGGRPGTGSRQSSKMGYTPSALFDSSAANTKIPQQQRNVVQRAVNFTFQLVLTATGVPQVVPGLIVPSNATVRVRGNNGTTAGNAKQIYVGASRDAVLNGGGTVLAPLDDIPFPADNTGVIWVNGTAGDGVVVSVVNPMPIGG